MNNENRINITSFARQLSSEGVLAAFPEEQEHPLKQSISAEKWLEQYSVVKPELYALTAVLSDRIVGRAYELRGERQPFGLITYDQKESLGHRVVKLQDLNSRFPFISIAMFLKDTLKSSRDYEVAEIKAGKSSPQVESIYRRLKDILDHLPIRDYIFDFSALEIIEKYKSVESFIEAGINTASTTMAGLLGIIPAVYGNLDNPERLVQIARNSYPLVLQLAMTNLESKTLDLLTPTLIGRPFPCNPKYYAIDESQDKARLSISKAGREQIKKYSDKDLKDFRYGKTPTIGCPAMVNFGDGSAIKKLWDWHVEIAEKIYPHLVAG